VNLLSGVEISITPEVLLVHSDHQLSTLSSALIGEGFLHTRTILNLHVDLSYSSLNPEQDLDRCADRHGIPRPYIGLMTAAYVDQARISIQRAEGIAAAAVVTAGLGNVSAAGLSPPEGGPPAADTINIILLMNRSLSRAAKVNAVITATEAKTALLQSEGIKTAEGYPATGTSTDAVVIAALNRGPEIRFTGPATTAGWLIGKAIREAMGGFLG
jgi:adenosylcobinamide amidohydrolase